MGKTSIGPAIPDTARSQGGVNHVPVQSVVKNERVMPERHIAQIDGSKRVVPSNTRTDY